MPSFPLVFFLLIFQAYVSRAGRLEVINYDGQCMMWSHDNDGCTGYSGSFGLLKGHDCSNLTKVVNGTRLPYPKLKVNVCGTENGSQVAWIEVSRSGAVTFINKEKDKLACILDNGLQAGSYCSPSHPKSTSTFELSAESSSSTLSTPSSTAPLITSSPTDTSFTTTQHESSSDPGVWVTVTSTIIVTA